MCKSKRNVLKKKYIKKKENISTIKSGNIAEKSNVLDEFNVTKEQMIAIQEEAYYRAIKRLRDEERQEEKDEEKQEKEDIPKKKYKWYDNIFYFLNVYFFPWKICKKYTIKNTVHDGVLVFFVSLILYAVGALMWLLGVMGTIYHAYQFLMIRNMFELEKFVLMVAVTVFGSFFILAGTQFEKETDSVKIYAYSASIFAVVSCVVAVIALIINGQCKY